MYRKAWCTRKVVFLLLAVAVATTLCCCRPEILLPWLCDVTLVLSIADTVHTYCCESVMLNYSSIRTTSFDLFFCLGSLKLVSVELLWSHWLLVTRANRSQVWCYTSKRKTLLGSCFLFFWPCWFVRVENEEHDKSRKQQHGFIREPPLREHMVRSEGSWELETYFMYGTIYYQSTSLLR